MHLFNTFKVNRMRNSPKSAPENNAYTENAAKQFCMKKTNVIFKTAHMSLGIE